MTTIEKAELETKAAAKERTVLFPGCCKNNSPGSPLWKVSDVCSSKGFVLMVQSQYIVDAEFYESKFYPQWCFPFKRLGIRTKTKKLCVTASSPISSYDPALQFKQKGQGPLSLSVRKRLVLGHWRGGGAGGGGGCSGKSLLFSPGSLWMWCSMLSQWHVETIQGTTQKQALGHWWHSSASLTNEKKFLLAVYPPRNMKWHSHAKFSNVWYS